MARLALLVACLALSAAAANMNGDYIAPANPSPDSSKPYTADYTAEYVDVYSPPIRTQYSEVFWTMTDAVDLPADLVARFANKTMAIVGYEADQVYKRPDGDVSVPIYYQYNHHFEAYMLGAHSKMFSYPVTAADLARGGHAVGVRYMTRSTNDPNPSSHVPTSQYFSEGNGGEYRKSYHGYPTGYAQLIDSPTQFQIQPMQIDTHNRDYNGTGFVAGPLPRSSQAPPGAKYSGLLECPCTTRITKDLHFTFASQTAGTCDKAVTNATRCYAAARTVGVSASLITANKTVDDPTLPNGCSLVPDGKGNYAAVLNALPKDTPGADCGTAPASAGLHVTGSLALPTLARISLDLNATAASHPTAGVATISLTGPATVWFGVGFNATVMADLPYTIVVNGTGGVEEHVLANHAAGEPSPTTVTVVSNAVTDGVRTVVLQRPLSTAAHTFNAATDTNIPVIMAVGSGPAFAYHQNKGSGQLTLVSVSAPTCVCDVGVTGTINGMAFSKNCLPEPYGDLLEQHNPTCNVADYAGGLHCCHHGWFLLDADQTIPAPVEEYHLKFRFWFEEYNATKHQNLIRLYYQTEAWSTEYDVPPCPAGTPADMCEHTITAHFKVSDMIKPCDPRTSPQCTGQPSKGIELIYAGGHCHAPSCISIDLVNGDTGELICRQTPVFGNSTAVFDEEGYIAIPPCLWGADDGLLPPQLLTLDTNLISIKRNNNTVGHYGEMASWQMRGIVV